MKFVIGSGWNCAFLSNESAASAQSAAEKERSNEESILPCTEHGIESHTAIFYRELHEITLITIIVVW